MEAVQLDFGVLPGTDILGDQIQLSHRQKEYVGARILNLDIVLDNAVDIQLVDTVENADAIGIMNHIIALGQVRQGTDFLSLAFFGLFGRQLIAAGNGGQAEPDLRILKAGGNIAGQHHDPSVLHFLQVLEVLGRQPQLPQVLGQIARRLGGTRHDHTAIFLLQHRLQIGLQQLQVSIPARILQRADGNQLFDLSHRIAGKGLQIRHPMILQPGIQLLRTQHIPVQAFAELTILQQLLHILAVLPKSCPGAFPAFALFTVENRRMVKIIQ